MDRRNLLAGGAGLFFAALFAGPAAARVASQAPLVDEGLPETEEVRGGGRGHGRGRGRGRGHSYGRSRGRHYGWTRGRGHAWGRRRRRGW